MCVLLAGAEKSVAVIRNLAVLSLLEQRCRFCGKAVVDTEGNRTEDFGIVQRGTYVCARCAKALEFALGD
jgi:DNA-directed RNA polymerase subunit RPC12/RpoP